MATFDPEQQYRPRRDPENEDSWEQRDNREVRRSIEDRLDRLENADIRGELDVEKAA